GLYVSPIPKEEILYSNLLPVLFFPETVFHASTDCKDDKEAGLLFRGLVGYPPAGWGVAGNRFFCFINSPRLPGAKFATPETSSQCRPRNGHTLKIVLSDVTLFDS